MRRNREGLANGGRISATDDRQRCKTGKGLIDGWLSAGYLISSLLIAVVPLGGCLSRSRPVALRTSTAQLQTATGNDLVERINAEATKIQTLKATVGITASVGGSKRGKITEYQEIRGYILARKPSSLRMIGLFPILQNHVFDMVSSGQEFKLWIPPKNQFIVGNNDEARPSTQPLGNLRPQVIYDALLLAGCRPSERTCRAGRGRARGDRSWRRRNRCCSPTTHSTSSNRTARGGTYRARLCLTELICSHTSSSCMTNTGLSSPTLRYDEYREFNGVLFPTNIQIWRPQEEYSIKLEVTKLTINGPIMDDQFVLEPPSGAGLASR